MQLLRLNALSWPPTSLTADACIGNFDGVHVGHQAMIQQLKAVAAAQQLKTVVMLFEPQPWNFLKVMMPRHVSVLCGKKSISDWIGHHYIAVAKFTIISAV